MKTYFICLISIKLLLQDSTLLADSSPHNSHEDEIRQVHDSYTWGNPKEGVKLGVRLSGTKLELVLGLEDTTIKTNTETKFSYIKWKPNFSAILSDEEGSPVKKTPKGQTRKINKKTYKINTLWSAVFKDETENLVFFDGLMPQFIGVVDLKDEFFWKEAGRYKIDIKLILLKKSDSSKNTLVPFELPNLIFVLELPGVGGKP